MRLLCANRNGNSGNCIQRVELKDNTLKIKLFWNEIEWSYNFLSIKNQETQNKTPLATLMYCKCHQLFKEHVERQLNGRWNYDENRSRVEGNLKR